MLLKGRTKCLTNNFKVQVVKLLSCVNETILGRGLQLVLKIVLLQLNVLFKKFSNAETFIISKIALSIVEEWTQKKAFIIEEILA